MKHESAIEQRYEIWKRYESMKALLKMHKCPEIIAGANFSFKKLCLLNNNYALCILLRKIPSSDDFANIIELLYTF
jgi:hypothetical protein